MAPIFITGHWNSGTTLLVDILRKHPQIALRRARYKPNLEERTIIKILKKLGADFIQLDENYANIIQHGFTHYREPDFDVEKRREFRRIFDQKFKVSSGKALLLKNPWLFFMPNFLNQNFDDLPPKKIIILRDGPGQVVSKDYWKRSKNDPEQHLYARAKFWVRCMEYYFEHWFEAEDTLSLRYENLCREPAVYIQQICAFSDLPFEPLAPTLPDHYQNRQTKWNQLDPGFQERVLEIVSPMQEKMDRLLPIG